MQRALAATTVARQAIVWSVIRELSTRDSQLLSDDSSNRQAFWLRALLVGDRSEVSGNLEKLTSAKQNAKNAETRMEKESNERFRNN
eukprot:6189786-Pleurochrysis_carterae.AAC.4